MKGKIEKAISFQRMLSWLTYLAFMGSWIISVPLSAQLLPDQARRLKVEDGLPSNNITDIFQDSRHYLWIGTINGLCRYNGKECELFVDDPSVTNQLKGDFVRSIYEDDEEYLYVLNHLGGFHRYDYRNTGKGFQEIIPGSAFPKLKGLGISAFILYADQSYAYIMYDDTIRKYDKASHQMTLYDPFAAHPEFNGFQFTQFRPIRYSLDKVAAFNQKYGFVIFNIHTGEILFTTPELVRQELASIKEAVQVIPTIPYVLMLGESGRFWLFDWVHQTLLHEGVLPLPDKARIISGLPLLNGMIMYTYDLKSVFTYDLRSFYTYDPIHKTTKDMQHLLKREDVYSTTYRGLFETIDGHTWVATNDGLLYWDTRNRAIHNYQLRIENMVYPELPNITSFTSDASHGLLIGTMGGIHDYVEAEDRFQIINSSPNARNKFSNGFVFADSHDSYVFYQAMKKVNLNGETIISCLLKGGQATLEAIDRAVMISVLVDTLGSNRYCWMGTGSRGLFLFDMQHQTVEHVPILKNGPVPGEVQINALAIHPNGQLLVGCRKTGLYFVDRDSKKVTKSFHYDQSGKDGLPNGIIMSVLVQEDTIWLVEQSVGLVKMTFNKDETPVFTILAKEHGLNNTLLYSGQIDAKGNIWISTQSGIEKWDVQHKRFFHLGPEQSIMDNQFRHPSWKDAQGRMYFAAVHSFISFHPDSVKVNETPPYVFLKSIQVNAHDRSELIEKDALELKYYEKNLALKFDAIEFHNPKRILFRYKFLKDTEEKVDYTITDRLEMTLPNLSPGTYTIIYNASNEHGFWNASDKKLIIRIPVAWYASIWFLLLSGILTSGILYALYRYRIRQLKSILTLRNRISRDLHDDVGSSLGSISIYSEVLKNLEGEQKKLVLDKVGETSREMLEKLNDLVWNINPANDQMDKIESRMRGFAAMTLNPLGIQFDIVTDADLKEVHLDMEKRRNLFLIFKEAVHNAAKYSGCQKMEIHLHEEKGKWRLIIRDDGIGFDAASINAYNGNGLKSMEERALAMHARLNIQSHPGQGTRIEVDQI